MKKLICILLAFAMPVTQASANDNHWLRYDDRPDTCAGFFLKMKLGGHKRKDRKLEYGFRMTRSIGSWQQTALQGGQAHWQRPRIEIASLNFGGQGFDRLALAGQTLYQPGQSRPWHAANDDYDDGKEPGSSGGLIAVVIAVALIGALCLASVEGTSSDNRSFC